MALTDDSLSVWVVGAVLGGGLAVLGFLLRNAFTTMTASIDVLAVKVDALKAAHAQESGDRRVLEVELRNALQRIERLERTVEQMSEGVVR